MVLGLILRIFSVCEKSSGLCNIYGSLNCDDCGKKCKIGYTGDRCQACSEGSTLIDRENGVIDPEGVGVKCGKYEIFL